MITFFDSAKRLLPRGRRDIFCRRRLALGARQVFLAHGASHPLAPSQGRPDLAPLPNEKQPLFRASRARTWRLCALLGGELAPPGFTKRDSFSLTAIWRIIALT